MMTWWTASVRLSRTSCQDITTTRNGKHLDKAQHQVVLSGLMPVRAAAATNLLRPIRRIIAPPAAGNSNRLVVTARCHGAWPVVACCTLRDRLEPQGLSAARRRRCAARRRSHMVYELLIRR